jgi:integrase
MSIRIPKYPKKAHSSGQARIRFRGRAIYLGRFGSAESRAKYHRVIAEHLAVTPADPPALKTATVVDLAAAFIQWADARYVKNGEKTSESRMFRTAIKPAVEMYGTLFADSFGPLALMACRDVLATRHCRSKANDHMRRIRRMFKWGVAREMVKAETWIALKAVEGLRRGQGVERKPVVCVPRSHVDAIMPFVLPPIWAMIQLQQWSAMRPGEVCSLRTCDIHEHDQEIPSSLLSECWIYRPVSHKTEHHDRKRVVLIGPQAQDILRAWMRPTVPELNLFSPAEAVAFSRAERAAGRKSKRYGVRAGKRHPMRAPRPFYSPHAYAHAIAVACKKAGVPRWSPNRLRHNAATLIRQRYGVEVARIILGHVNLNTTEIYAELDFEKAAKAIAELG